MSELRSYHLVESVKDYLTKSGPFLGTCVGVQWLFDNSVEFDSNDGLGVIPGKVLAIPTMNSDSEPNKVPHIGWSPMVGPDFLN